MGKNQWKQQQKKIVIGIIYQNQKIHDKATMITVFIEINNKLEDRKQEKKVALWI